MPKSLRAVLAAMVAALALSTAAQAAVLIQINKSTQQMTVSVDGEVRWHWPVSTGRPGHDTPNGTFKAFRMEADHFSREWDDAPMPHSIFFTRTGHAIHGYLNTRNIGRPASHGCVRLSPDHAAKLYALVAREGVLNTTVKLTGDVMVAARRSGRTLAARPAPVEAPAAEPESLAPPAPVAATEPVAPPSYSRPFDPLGLFGR